MFVLFVCIALTVIPDEEIGEGGGEGEQSIYESHNCLSAGVEVRSLRLHIYYVVLFQIEDRRVDKLYVEKIENEDLK